MHYSLANPPQIIYNNNDLDLLPSVDQSIISHIFYVKSVSAGLIGLSLNRL